MLKPQYLFDMERAEVDDPLYVALHAVESLVTVCNRELPTHQAKEVRESLEILRRLAVRRGFVHDDNPD